MEDGSARFDDGAATEPLSREALHASQEDQPWGGERGHESRLTGDYAAGRSRTGFGGGGRRAIETRPFFLTSEFLGTVLAIVALGITAGVMDIIDARLTWILCAAMVFGYVLSRGLAKAGSDSHSFDPREELLRRGAGDGHGERRVAREPQTGYGPLGALGGRRGGQPIETRPFFLTSEFVGTLLAIIAISVTAAAMPNLGARLTWILIAAMVATYAVSRGVAKAGTRSHSLDPRESLLGSAGGGSQQVQGSGGAMHALETRPFFLTSEFVGTLFAIVAIAISAATIDILDVRLTWILITAMVCGYVLSRGIAKIGVKSHSLDPREQLLERAPGGNAQQQREPSGHR
jgi:hypothetical protein